jgi:hypothetical protein
MPSSLRKAMGSEELVSAIRRLAHPRPPVEIKPGCAFGNLVDERLRALEGAVDEIRGRVNALFFLVVGAVAVEVVLRLVR